MGARIEYFSERFGKSYYLHWGANNKTWNTLSKAGVVDMSEQVVFEETLRKEMGYVIDYDGYENKLFKSSKLLFDFMKNHSGFIKRSELIAFDETLENIDDDSILTSWVMIDKENKVFHLGSPYPGSSDSIIGDVIGYIGKIEDIELLGEFEVAIKGDVVARLMKPDHV